MTVYKGTIIHAFVTLSFCLIGLGWAAVAFYVGRELAQAEYRYIKAHGGKRSDSPWYCGVLYEAWTPKGVLDWLLPVVIATIYEGAVCMK